MAAHTTKKRWYAFFMKKKTKWVLAIIFVLCWAAGMFVAANSPEISGQVEAAQVTDTEFIALTSKLIVCYEYKLCGHTIKEEQEMPADYVGLDKQELREQLGAVSITSFSAKEVVLTKRLDGYCPEHLVVYLEGEQLCVYRALLGSGENEQIEVFDIPQQELWAAEIYALQQGKVFGSIAEVRSYIKQIQIRGKQ